MKLLKARSKIINFLEQKHVYIILYFLFVLLFFISPDLNAHCNFYYAIILIYLISLKKIKFKVFFRSKIWLISMFLLAYLLLTLLWEKNTGAKGEIYYIRKALYVFVFLGLTMELVLKYPRFIEKIFVFLAWVGAGTAVFSIVCFYSSAPFPSARLEYFADQLRNPVLGGIIYGMIVLIVYFNIFKKATDRSSQYLYGALMIIITGSILLSQSRGPAASLLVTFIMGGLVTRDKKLLFALGCIIMIGAALFLNVKQVQQAVKQRGFSYRIELTQKTFSMAKEDLLFGKGITTDQQITAHDGTILYHPHNVYLGMILYGGLAGLFILLVLLAVAFRESLNHYFLTKNITFFVLILFGAFNMITSQDKVLTHPGPLWFYFWFPLGLLSGLACQREQKSICFNQSQSPDNE